MSEMDPNLPPTLDAVLAEFYKGPRPDSAFAVRLEAQLRQHQTQMLFTRQKSIFSFSNSKRSLMQTLRARPVLAFLAAILALMMLTGMAYAVGRLTGFIPGFGFTSNTGTVFILAEPVESSQAGITLRIDNAVSDDNRFWATLTARGLTGQQTNTQVFALLPDGKKLQFEGGVSAGSNPSGSQAQISYTFPALPSGTKSLTLLLENLDGQNFNLGLHLRPTRTDEIIPVQPTRGAQPQSKSQNGVRLVLDNVAPASDKTIIQVSIKYDRPNTSIAGPWDIRLSDQAGMLYPLRDITPGTMNSGDTRIYETSPFSGTEQLTFSLNIFPGGDVLPMMEDFSTEGSGFTFDPGISPKTGQTWDLNEIIHAGQFTLHVVRATLTDGPSLVFEFEPAGNVTGVMVSATDPLLRSSSGGVPVQDGNFSAGMTFGKIPSQPFKVVIMWVYYTATGPWQLQWQPPASPTAAANRPTPTTSSTLVPLATPTRVSDPLALEVQQLAQKFEAPLHQGPGWVHVVTENIATPHAGQNYPPPYLRTEQWYEIDADGYITRLLSTDRDKAGQILQQAATVGNYSMNFTYGNSGFNNGKRYRVLLDELTGTLSRAAQNNAQIVREQSTCENGSPCLLITIHEKFAQPSQNPGEIQPYYGSMRRVWIDAQTGQQVKTENSWLLKDDQEAVNSTNRVLAVEKVDAAPQEILNVLAKVIVP